MVFRRDPIPGIGGKWFDCYKRPKTQQERRYSFAYPKRFVRARRNATMLPNAWDDIPRSDIYDRCWKRSKKRRKQWMR